MKPSPTTPGKVWLVGAGPGDPELLTLKALRAIESAHAVVYDRLISEAVMNIVPPSVERHFAGKSCKQKAMTQEEIQQLLVTLAREGKNVVRLKGGDPYFFGRGGEEALHLLENGISFEVIPGITSAQGCAAAAGIPLTHRGLATGVRFITGHRTTGEEAEQPLDLNWQSLADPQTTLVVYMGLANLSVIAENLIKHGLPATTPAIAISQGTTPAQRTCRAPLDKLAIEVKKMGLESPVLVIIGQATGLSDLIAPQASLQGSAQSVFASIATKN